jgi:large subunit ribosomal protein L1
MAKLTKKQKKKPLQNWKEQIILFKDASSLLKVIVSAKFDESVDIVKLSRSKKSKSNGKRVVTFLMELEKILKY